MSVGKNTQLQVSCTCFQNDPQILILRHYGKFDQYGSPGINMFGALSDDFASRSSEAIHIQPVFHLSCIRFARFAWNWVSRSMSTHFINNHKHVSRSLTIARCQLIAFPVRMCVNSSGEALLTVCQSVHQDNEFHSLFSANLHKVACRRILFAKPMLP